MSANKSAQVTYHPASKTLILSLSPTSSFHPNSTRTFPQKVKKLKQTDSVRKQKAVRLIQDIANFHIDLQQQARSQSVNKRFLKESGKISAYLNYKKQQQILKMNHCFNNNYLKTRCYQKRNIENRSGVYREYHSQTFQRSPRNKAKSMSRVNLELTPSSKKSESNQPKTETKSRQFYIKTSEGKRKRVTVSQYQNQIRSRVGKSEGSTKNQFLTGVKQFSQNHLIFTLNELQPSSQKTKTSNTTRQLKHYKNKSNALLLSKDEQTLVECRPWTSHKSDFEN